MLDESGENNPLLHQCTHLCASHFKSCSQYHCAGFVCSTAFIQNYCSPCLPCTAYKSLGGCSSDFSVRSTDSPGTQPGSRRQASLLPSTLAPLFSHSLSPGQRKTKQNIVLGKGVFFLVRQERQRQTFCLVPVPKKKHPLRFSALGKAQQPQSLSSFKLLLNWTGIPVSLLQHSKCFLSAGWDLSSSSKQTASIRPLHKSHCCRRRSCLWVPAWGRWRRGRRNHVATLKGTTYTLYNYCLDKWRMYIGCSDHAGVTYRLVLGMKI